MSGRRLRPMEAISATRLEARVSGASSCLRRKAGGCSTVVSLSLATMSMKTIVTTKEAFELNYKREKQCLLRWPSVLFHPRRSSSSLPSSFGLQCSRFFSNPVTMMGMLDYNSDDDAEDDNAEDDDSEDYDADDNDEHNWK